MAAFQGVTLGSGMAHILETALVFHGGIPCPCARVEALSHSVVSSALRPRGLYPPPGFSVHEILQAGILEWTAISSYFYVNW